MSDHTALDQDTLEMLKDVMEDGFNDLIMTYLTDSEVRVAALAEAIESRDSEAVRREAHSLKGSSGNIGATGLAGLCLVVEHKGRDGDLSGLEENLSDIRAAFAIISDSLKALLN
ncbi:Hpt domain-containing protein [Aurantivibrio plasticivorans]